MKLAIITGNIGKDAVTRQTQGGESVTGFSVAVEERRGQEKRSVWFDVAIWGKRGEALAQYLTKGSKVSVAGDLGTREHDGKTYLTIRAHEVTLCGGGRRDDDAPRDARPAQGGGPAGGYGAWFDDSDEVPF